MNRNKQQSFTLIELLVVIVIIGILAGAIVISTSSSIDKANFAKAQAFSNTVQNELLLNLVSEWTFDEGTNQTINRIATNDDVKDSWGTNHGIVYSNPQIKGGSDCVSGRCMSFDGVDDYIKVLNNDIFNVDSITIGAWVKNTTSTPINWATIVAKGNQASNNHFWLHYSTITNGFRLECGNGVTRKSASQITSNFLVNTWYYVVGTYSSDSMRIYVNGVSGIVQTELSGDLGISDYNLTIGRSSYKDDYYWSGLIDQVRIYNTALSSSQIKQNYIVGLNSMLSNGNISKQEYNERIEGLSSK